MKKIIVLITFLLVSGITWADIDSGFCGINGENLKWTLSDNYTLTISGEGDMANWEHFRLTPWFGYKEKITKLSIENNVTSIGDDAFVSCSHLIDVTIPNTVKRIGFMAFSGCESLTTINMPNTLTQIEEHVFEGCKSLKEINIPKTVTSIGAGAFKRCKSLTTVNIPTSVTNIGSDAFSECSSLTTINIPETIKIIKNNTFSYCESLISIDIPNSITSIGSNAFSRCQKLTSITIPDSVTSIGDYAFAYCSNLSNIKIGNSVCSIGSHVFDNCNNLTTLTIPNSVKVIKNEALRYCIKIRDLCWNTNIDAGSHVFFNNVIKNLFIGDDVNTVYSTFSTFTSLSKVVLGKNVAHIKSEAFGSCKELKELYITSSEPPFLEPKVFAEDNLGITVLYVPEEDIDYYKNTTPWNKFGKILPHNRDVPNITNPKRN